MASIYPPTGAQPPSVELTVRQGPQPGQRFSSNKPTIVIGREVGNDVAINDPQVSRHHASLTWDGRQFIIQDLDSVNGTFVNGVRLTAPRVLQPGDVIGLGPTVLLGFQVMLPVVSPAAPPAYAPPPPVVSPVKPPAYAPRPPARRRGRFLIPLIALLGLCILLAAAAAAGYYFLWPRPEARPLVLINSPRHGEQVEVGQEVTVHSVARDERKVIRVELWVDGQLQETQASNLPGGTSPFPLLARWRPSSPGSHTLIARAFNARGGRGQASVNVEAIQRADRDGDGVTDEADACPDEPGSPAARGCPDGDGDGIPDAEDACPDEAGLPEADGCPSPSEEDRDGDGVLDEADGCPDDPGSPRADGCPDGDGDGIPDAEDACPDEPGLPEHDGCPVPGDMDGDGVPDAEDECPEESGLPEHAGCPDGDGDGIRDGDDECPDEPGPAPSGCPDRDGDGVRDRDDACPNEPGPAPSGCPDTGAGDRDGDGIPDDVDLCPNDPGPGPTGCPSFGGSGDTGSDEGSSGGGPFGELGGDITVFPVEFEALEFEVDHEYQEVHCYASLADEAEERYDFEPLGETQWDIAAVLGGENSRTVAVHEDEPLEVHVECWSSNIYPVEVEESPGGIPEGSAWGTVWDLGSFTANHPREDWDGHVITATGSVGEYGFQATYRICQDSCEEAAFAPPVLTLWSIGDLFQLRWRWDGDEGSIHGFNVYRNGNYAFHLSEPSARSVTLIEEPPCGQRWEYQVAAYSGPDPVHPDRESPRSNIRLLQSLPCPRTVRVQFRSLQTGDLGDDEYWAHGESVGPITGFFWASGNTRQELDFHTSECPILSGSCSSGDIRHGLRLSHNATYRVQDLFDWVHTEQVLCGIGDCPAHSYWAPEVDFVTVQLDDRDDLTFGAKIVDLDSGVGESGRPDTLFEADYTIPAEGVPVPGGGGGYTIHDRNIDLRVWVMTLHD
jgi:hypothetical protein